MSREKGKNGGPPEIALMFCEHCAKKEASQKMAAIKAEGIKIRPIMLPCSSKIETGYVLRALADGVDGVEVVGCSEQACRFLVGSNRAEKRVGMARRYLDEIGVGADRIGITRGSGFSTDDLVGKAVARAKAVEKLGPISSKG